MEDDHNIVFLVLSGALIMLCISLLVIYFVFTHRRKFLLQQHELLRIQSEKDLSVLRAIVETQEIERNRIAQNLHDSIGAELSMVHLNLTRFLHILKPLPPEAVPMEREIESLEESVSSIRNICHDLFPISLKKTGFLFALGKVCESIDRSKKVNCTFSCEITEDQLPDDLTLKVNYLRICQELCNNILKHSGFTKLHVSVVLHQHHLLIHFKHNGKSFTNAEATLIADKQNGIGLTNIANRMDLLGGTVNYERQQDTSEINVTIPLNHGKKN